MAVAVCVRNDRTRTAELELTPEDGRHQQITKSSRDALIEAYLPLVRRVAEKIHRRLPRQVDVDSLIQAGAVGLLEALDRYDPAREVTLPDYARYRIQGAIIDYLRSLDWVSRSVRAWGRHVGTARSRLIGRLGREATSEEVASELGIALEKYHRVDQQVNEATLLSLEDVCTAIDEEWKSSAADSSFPLSSQDPLVSVEEKQQAEKLATAIEQLSERERQVVTLYYYREFTLSAIGELLGLTEARICQIRTQAVARLQQILADTSSLSLPFPEPILSSPTGQWQAAA